MDSTKSLVLFSVISYNSQQFRGFLQNRLLSIFFITCFTIIKFFIFNVEAVSHRDVESTTEQKEVLKYKLKMEDITTFIDRVKKGHRPDFETYRPVPELEKLITICWNADMVKRPTANMVLTELQKLTKSQNIKHYYNLYIVVCNREVNLENFFCCQAIFCFPFAHVSICTLLRNRIMILELYFE